MQGAIIQLTLPGAPGAEHCARALLAASRETSERWLLRRMARRGDPIEAICAPLACRALAIHALHLMFPACPLWRLFRLFGRRLGPLDARLELRQHSRAYSNAALDRVVRAI